MFILGTKKGMTQIFSEDGKVTPVTVIEAGPASVELVRTKERDGYSALQIKFGSTYKEFKIDETENQKKKEDIINLSEFQEGDKVKVSGISVGKGFQGGVKRHGFSGGPKTHGHRHVLRTLGSIGSSFPQHVRKGQKMPGRAGGRKTTLRGLKIVKIDQENNILAIKGAIPGKRGASVIIKKY